MGSPKHREPRGRLLGWWPTAASQARSFRHLFLVEILKLIQDPPSMLIGDSVDGVCFKVTCFRMVWGGRLKTWRVRSSVMFGFGQDVRPDGHVVWSPVRSRKLARSKEKKATSGLCISGQLSSSAVKRRCYTGVVEWEFRVSF